MAELSNLLGQFSRQHRQLDVRIVVEQSHVLRQALVDRELDLALHQDFIPRIEARDQLLWTEQVHWCARPGWQPAPDECVRLITFGPGCFYRQLAQERLSALGIRWQVVVECGSVEGVVSAIAAGLGIGLLSSDHLDKRVEVYRLFDQRMPLPCRGQPRAPVTGVAAAVDTGAAPGLIRFSSGWRSWPGAGAWRQYWLPVAGSITGNRPTR